MKQIIPFSGVQNSDANPKNIPLGEHQILSMMEDGRYYGRGGSLVCKRGTSDIGTILTAGEIVIGTAKWIERNRIVYFVYSDEGAHFIAFYDFTTQSHTKLISVLESGFDPNYPILHAEVIDNILWWTEGKFEGFYDNGLPLHTPPFRLNLERAENGEYGTNADLQTIDVIKYPSPYSPTWEYSNTISLSANYLRGKLFQFRIQYVYEDGEESAWSPISRLNLPESAGFINNGSVPIPNSNAIRLEFNTGHFTVTQIKIAVSVNQGQFGIFKTLDKAIEGIPSEDDYLIDYTGDTSYQAVELDTRNYDNVPLVSACMSKLVNEISYTNIIRGYDRLLPDIDIEYPISELDGYKLWMQFFRVESVEISGAVYTLQLSMPFNGALYFEVGDYYTFRLAIINSPENVIINFEYSITQSDVDDANAAPTPADGVLLVLDRIGDNLLSQINALISTPATGSIIAGIYTIVFSFPSNYIGNEMPGTMRPLRLQNTQRTLKKGGKYKWYIQYYDRGNRDGTAITSEAMEARVPFVTDQDVSSLSYAGAPYKVNARLTINHYPPDWATHYQILVSKDNGITDFQQTTVTHVQVLDDGNYRLTLQNQYEQANKGAVINHQVKKGDRIRFMATGVDDTIKAPVNYITNYFECEVLEYQAGEGVDNAPAIYVQRFDLALIDWNNQNAIQVEIYTPSIDSDVERIFEIGEEYPILNATTENRYHGGNTQDQTGSLPAILDLDYGDAYIRQRWLGTGYDYPSNLYCFYCEDYNYSDYFKSDYNSRGRVAIENVNAKTDRLNISVHGGKYLRANNTSDINNMSRFEFGDNTQEYDSQFGFVTRTITDGKTLKVLQPQKETSVYLNGTYSVNADGAVSAPAFSSKVFGGFRPYDTLFGCSDPRMAILVPRMGVFYFDVNSEEFIYSLNNGQKRVSLEAAFLTKSKQIANICRGDNFYCWAFTETQLGKVGMNFRSDNGEVTITFSYDLLRFTADHLPKAVWAYENIGDNLIAFDSNQSTYLYNVDNRTNFHGAAFTCDVDVFCNENLIQPKVFKNIQYQGIKPFYLLCSIEANDTYAYQETTMSPNTQETLEGAHFVQVRKNIYSGTLKSQDYYMVNGRPMRGNYMQVRLYQAPVGGETFPEISAAIVEYFPSEIINA